MPEEKRNALRIDRVEGVGVPNYAFEIGHRESSPPHSCAPSFLLPLCARCRFFETFSYLPPLSDSQIAKQVDYIINNGWTPCLEVADVKNAYISNENCVRINNTTAVSDPALLPVQDEGIGASASIGISVPSCSETQPRESSGASERTALQNNYYYFRVASA